MVRTTFPHQSLILVCDGAKALVFENAGDSQRLNLEMLELRAESHASTAQIGSERPGRVFESVGSARSSVEQLDWHFEEETRFLRAVAHSLDRLVTERQARHLVIVAAARALGILRQAISSTTFAVLKAEICKDLIKLPKWEIEEHLARLSRLA